MRASRRLLASLRWQTTAAGGWRPPPTAPSGILRPTPRRLGADLGSPGAPASRYPERSGGVPRMRFLVHQVGNGQDPPASRKVSVVYPSCAPRRRRRKLRRTIVARASTRTSRQRSSESSRGVKLPPADVVGLLGIRFGVEDSWEPTRALDRLDAAGDSPPAASAERGSRGACTRGFGRDCVCAATGSGTARGNFDRRTSGRPLSSLRYFCSTARVTCNPCALSCSAMAWTVYPRLRRSVICGSSR